MTAKRLTTKRDCTECGKTMQLPVTSGRQMCPTCQNKRIGELNTIRAKFRKEDAAIRALKGLKPRSQMTPAEIEAERTANIRKVAAAARATRLGS